MRLTVVQQYSTHQKHKLAGEKIPSMHGIAAQRTSTTERGKSTSQQQADSEHLHKQPFTHNIAPCQLKYRWIQEHE